jgi:FPC/CPF motif-containing protein YcgG
MLLSPSATAIDAFAARIAEPGFPCVGAKSALARQDIAYVVAGDLRCPRDDASILAQVQYFAHIVAPDAVFLSQVVLFPDTPALDEPAFEHALWERLQGLHRLDARTHAWDPSVSDDPDSAQFSLSLGGRAFYVIGLHPGASRPARRFPCAALVFNLHSQFETLRADGRYEKLRDTIIERDIADSGSRNPMLARHGEASEARQYSGRQVDAHWRCPFAAQSGGADAA